MGKTSSWPPATGVLPPPPPLPPSQPLNRCRSLLLLPVLFMLLLLLLLRASHPAHQPTPPTGRRFTLTHHGGVVVSWEEGLTERQRAARRDRNREKGGGKAVRSRLRGEAPIRKSRNILSLHEKSTRTRWPFLRLTEHVAGEREETTATATSDDRYVTMQPSRPARRVLDDRARIHPNVSCAAGKVVFRVSLIASPAADFNTK